MNYGAYRLVFNKLRGMLVAVEETVSSTGKTNNGETRTVSSPAGRRTMTLFAMRHTAFAVSILAGAVPLAHAQIVTAPGSGASVIQTANGLPQVNIAKPSGAGVSVNTYSQFDVQKNGAILNNSANIVATQQAGYINGNPNLQPGQPAKIIVNQVNSNSPSQLRGYLEVAGSRAEVVIANASGLIVDGAGFINTSRAILTTGSPVYGPNGALSGFDVRGGRIAVQGAGMNASNVDQVDLIARAVQANAAVYGNALNVVTGTNHVDHDTLAATPIAGEGAVPAIAIDVGQLGGMYANRIFLTSNEFGVGVSNRGVIAAQAGDLTLAANGRLQLAGRTNASGNMSLAAQGGIDNSGSTYAQHDLSVNTKADVTNGGTLAAQRNTSVTAGSVASSGTLGAGIDGDGSVANAGNLKVETSGALTATGHNAAGGDASLSGASTNLAGSRTSANGNLALSAGDGDMTLAGATTVAGGTLAANAKGTLTNDNAVLSSSGAQTITAGVLSNASGQIVSKSTLDVKTSGATNNARGVIQAAGRESIRAASLDNTAGRVTALSGDGLTVATTGALVNAPGTTSTGDAGGVIGTNGALTLSGGAVSNQGQITAKGNATVRAQSLDNHAGTVLAAGDLGIAVADALDNRNGTLSGSGTVVNATSADNSGGTIEGDQLALSTTANLANRGGKIRQYGQTEQHVSSGGALDNTGGTIASNASSLSLSAQSIVNDGGTLDHAGTGTLGVAAATISNTAGGIVTDGTLDVSGNTVSNHGTMSAKGDASVHAQSLDNQSGKVVAAGGLSATLSGVLNNRNGLLSGAKTTVAAASGDNSGGGTIEGDQLVLSTTGDLVNRGGTLRQYGTANQRVSAGGVLDNTAGTIVGNASDLSVSAQSLINDSGAIQQAGTGTLDVSTAAAISNAGGKIVTNGSANVTGGAISNQGQISAKRDATVHASSFDNHAGSLAAAGNVGVTVAGALDNASGTLSGATATVTAASADNTSGTIEGDRLAVSTTGDLVNRGGTLRQYGATDQTVSAGGKLDNTGGTIATNAGNLAVVAQSIANGNGGSLQHAGTGALTLAALDMLANAGGQIATNGSLNAQAGRLDNTSGSLSAQGMANFDVTSGFANRSGTVYGRDGLAVTTQGALDSTSGSMQTAGNLTLSAGATLSNAHGTISANGQHGTMLVASADIDNTGGTLTDAGDGAMTITAATGVTNTAGTMGGNGDVTVAAQTLTNTAGAKLVAGGAANLDVTASVNNAGGTVYGGTALNLNRAGVRLTNDGGTLEGGADVSARVGSLSNAGGAIRANRDIVASGAVSGAGTMTSGRNLTLNVAGNYINDASNRLHADGDMSVSATGTLTNTGTLAASGSLAASGAQVVNAAGADMKSASTTINASGTLANAGRIEGDSVTTNSATLANTGTVIGNNVRVNAADIQNSGAAALIAGAQNVKLYASNSVSNMDGALIYSAGNLEIAQDGTRDGAGMLAHQTATLTNSSADIEADGNLDIAAHTIVNKRTTLVAEAGTPQSETSTLSLWTAGIPIGVQTQSRSSRTFSQWSWGGENDPISGGMAGKLRTPVSVTVPKSQVANLDASTQTFSLTQPLTEHFFDSTVTEEVCNDHCHTRMVEQTRQIATNPTQWYQGLQDNGDTYTITFWPDWNPKTQIRPDQVRVRIDLGSDSHDYVETNRTTTTTTTTDRLVSASNAAKMQAQGAIRINADGGSIMNQSSIMSAGGNLVRRATGGSVVDTGTVLQQTVTEQDTSTFYWHQKTGGDNDTKTVVYPNAPVASTTVAALPAIATSNQAVQTNAASITVGSVNRVGQTVTGSGVTGGDATGTQLGGVTGETSEVRATTGVMGQTARAGSANGATGGGARPQTLGSASSGIPDLTLPVNGLYKLQPAPGAAYLVATDPRFTSYNNFISSDYMLSALNLNPQTTQKRLGDGFYEEKLIRDQVTQLTGRTLLAGYADNLAEYTALMNSGVTYAKQFGLTPGIGLNDAQMKQLTTDMVWLVSQDVALPDGTHQSVLVPKLYLAQADTVDLQHSGALVSGNSVTLNATGDVSNSGHIVSDVATTVLGNNIVNRGVIGSGGTTVVAAVQDVRNVSGRIGGVDTVVQAGRDIVNETETFGVTQTLRDGNLVSTATSQGTLATGTISASRDVTIVAGRDLSVVGASIAAGNDALVAAGRDIDVRTTTLTATQDAHTDDRLNGGRDSVTRNLGSTIATGGSLAAISGRDMTLSGSTVQAGGDASMVAGNNLTVTAAKDTQTHDERSLGGSLTQHTASSYDETARGSTVNAAGNVLLGAGQTETVAGLLAQQGVSAVSAPAGGGNISVLGSNVTTGSTAADGTMSGGGAKLVATGDVTVGAVTETHDSQSWTHDSRSGFMSSSTMTDEKSSHRVVSAGSTVSGDTVTASAGKDLTVAGSTVASTHDLSLSAGRDLDITTTQDTSRSSHFHEETKSGLGAGGGAGISYGNTDTKDTTHDNSVTHNGSVVGSTNGSVSLLAGKDLHITGSEVIAAGDITGKAVNVTIDSATNTNHHDETHETKTSGFTLGLSGSIGNAIMTAASESRAASNSEDGRASALHSIAAAGAVGNAGAKAMMNPSQKPDIGVQLSFGTSESKSTSKEDQTTQTGSTVKAGGTAVFIATGDGTQGSGNVTIAGSDVSANNVLLDAKNQVNVVNTTNTDSTRSSNSSSSASVGVSYSLGGGFGISASMSNAHGDSNSDAVMQNNSHVTGANSLTIRSGGDTNIIGSDVAGRQVKVDVGGDLNVASVQDTTVSAAHQSSSGGGFSISQYGGASASFSAQRGNADGNYAAVNEQAGIKAGDGGYAIDVKGNTDLKGAYVASDADASKNSLTTGSLSFSDIENHSHYSANSAGVTIGGAGMGIVPMMPQFANGDESALTRSGVSAGSITVTNAANQKQDVAGLNRDTSNLNGTVSKLPDINDMLSRQSDLMNAANAAGSQVAQAIGTYADYRKAQALDAAKAAALRGDTGAAAQYKAEADAWSEGGANRVGLHMVGGAVLGGLGAGGALGAGGGAAGAGVSAALAPKLNDLANDFGAPGTLEHAIGNGIANVIATAAGAAVGGGAGAATASMADMYNRQLHPEEQSLIKKLAQDKASRDCNGDAACIGKATVFWSDLLERTAKGLVDDRANAENMTYLQSVLQTANDPGSEGARGGVAAYLENLRTAEQMLTPYMGKAITVNGVAVTADGAQQTYFSATAAQRADTYANYVLGTQPPAPVVPGVEARDESRLEYLGARNGAAQPDYTLEQALLGGAFANRVMGTVERIIASLDVGLAGPVSASAKGNISASQITMEGMPARLSTAEQGILSQIDNLGSTALQGDAREYVANNYFVRNGYTPLDGKCGAGNCFDGVYIKGDTVYINEVKPLNPNGSIKLSGPSDSMSTQMTDEWIGSAVRRLENSGNPESIKTAQLIKSAINENRLVKLVSGVNGQGMTTVKLGGK
ncbi:hemagglutinin repeat-containing protein [Trinickia caryophylli]|uniref:hemagglutinin repeat-containing protein n=1 Tax=Trinickia caryophylli TaxID=28094 RepID=UPI000C88561B|nr:hemagglutinin repeat-containing protein [Trinickia caryophylli]PMS13217.1 filamentous hemagglutinin [Trinickia caryophylli]